MHLSGNGIASVCGKSLKTNNHLSNKKTFHDEKNERKAKLSELSKSMLRFLAQPLALFVYWIEVDISHVHSRPFQMYISHMTTCKELTQDDSEKFFYKNSMAKKHWRCRDLKPQSLDLIHLVQASSPIGAHCCHLLSNPGPS